MTGQWVTGLWNPTTREYKMIPTSKETIEFQSENWNWLFVRSYGFGYDFVGNDYKLVEISSHTYDEIMVSEVAVYTLSLNSWKRIEYTPYKITDKWKRKGVFVHEALHWLAKPCPKNNKFSRVILCFNVAEEVFHELPLLQIFDDIHKFEHICIDVLEGFLCMLCSHSSVGFEVWVMNDYGVGDSWTKRYDISRLKLDSLVPCFQYLRRIHSLRSGEILLEIQLTDTHSALLFYDPKHERAWVEEIELRTNGELPTKVSTARLASMLYSETFVESLVSLHSGTYVGGEQEKSDFNNAYGIYQFFFDWQSNDADKF